MSASGGGHRRLTAGEEPSWSPDGSFLFLSVPLGTDDELFRVRPDGSGRTAADEARGRRLHTAAPAGRSDRVAAAGAVDSARGSPRGRSHRRDVFSPGMPTSIRDLSGLEVTNQASIRAAARALARDAAAGRTALLASRPLSARGWRVRTESIAGFTAAQAVARNRLEMVRLAPQGKTAAKRIAALTKTYKANRNTMGRRFGIAFTETGL